MKTNIAKDLKKVIYERAEQHAEHTIIESNIRNQVIKPRIGDIAEESFIAGADFMAKLILEGKAKL